MFNFRLNPDGTFKKTFGHAERDSYPQNDGTNLLQFLITFGIIHGVLSDT